MVCANLREITRSFLRESSRLRIFVRGVNAKTKLFSRADLYIGLRSNNQNLTVFRSRLIP